MALGLQHFEMFKQTAADVIRRWEERQDEEQKWKQEGLALESFPWMQPFFGMTQCKDGHFPLLKWHEADIEPHFGPSWKTWHYWDNQVKTVESRDLWLQGSSCKGWCKEESKGSTGADSGKFGKRCKSCLFYPFFVAPFLTVSAWGQKRQGQVFKLWQLLLFFIFQQLGLRLRVCEPPPFVHNFLEGGKNKHESNMNQTTLKQFL